MDASPIFEKIRLIRSRIFCWRTGYGQLINQTREDRPLVRLFMPWDYGRIRGEGKENRGQGPARTFMRPALSL